MRHSRKGKRSRANGKRHKATGIRFQVPGSRFPKSDIRYRLMPLALRRYHLSGTNRKKTDLRTKTLKQFKLITFLFCKVIHSFFR
jgi:hypothetical protein